MIDFACKKFSLEEVIRCGLGLSKAEFSLFSYFIKNEKTKFSTEKLGRAIRLDVSTVQRGVKKLYALGVLSRMQTNLAGGGYQFEYTIKPKREVKALVMGIVHRWASRVEDEFEHW